MDVILTSALSENITHGQTDKKTADHIHHKGAIRNGLIQTFANQKPNNTTQPSYYKDENQSFDNPRKNLIHAIKPIKEINAANTQRLPL